MDWIPVSRGEFESILAEAIGGLSSEENRLYEQYVVPPFRQPCFRSDDYPNEQVYVVARNGDHLLFYDDVEEEFGVAIPDADGVLGNWGNYGPLVTALRGLDEEGSVS